MPPHEREAILREVSNLLHGHALAGIAISLVGSSLLALVLSPQIAFQPLASWWIAMQVTLFFRGTLLFSWHRQTKQATVRQPAREIARHTLGFATTGLGWAFFPILFFSQLDASGRATLATIVSGLAGGSAIVLAPKQSLSAGFCAALLLPISLLFLTSGTPDGLVLGTLGLSFLAVTIYSARLSHAALLRSIQLGWTNERLLRGMAEAQCALRDVNQDLEARVQSRTQDLLREVGEKERIASEIVRLARHDSLTGLYNRASLAERLDSALREATANATSVAVLFIDLDKFKEVNDIRGHFAGDQVLTIVAARLQSRLGPGADLARWGGDEFVVVLRQDAPPQNSAPDPEGAAAFQLATTLHQALAEAIDLAPEPVKIGATIGISLFPQHGQTQDALIRAADVAMYQGKQDRSASRIRLFDAALAEDLSRRHRFAQSLSRAVAEQALSLHFQPIVLVPSGQCVAMEALVRWLNPEVGPVPPSEFIPLAEKSGDIVAIGRWVLHEACRVAATWNGYPPPSVSVNVSTAQVSAGCLVDDVVSALHQSGLPAERLHIELTESLFAGNQELVGPTLQALRTMGVRISLDDFGTGFSSLAYLRTLPVDTIKIDKSFVEDIAGESRSIISAIVSISQAMNFALIAEGIETQSQMAALIAMGVSTHQGYLLSRPLPAEDIPAWLASRAHPLEPLAHALQSTPQLSSLRI